MLSAANLAKRLGYQSISGIEFAVTDGSGIMDMEYHAEDIQKLMGVNFEIYGFAESEEIDVRGGEPYERQPFRGRIGGG